MNEELRAVLLKVVLGVAAVGHLVVGLSFWFFPELAIDEILAWGNPSGWTSILGAYDIAVACGLLIAFRDPGANRGLIHFVAILLTIHAGTHAYYNIWGDAPPRLWLTTAYLLLGAALLAWLAPRVRSHEVSA